MEVKHTKCTLKTTVLHLVTQKPEILWYLFGKVGKKTLTPNTHITSKSSLAAIKLHLCLH